MTISNILRVPLTGFVAAILFLTGCDGSALPPEAFTITGTVEYIELEGGCWTILSDRDERYEPLGMPGEFLKDGLRIQAEIKVRPNMGSVCQVGTIAEILDIRRRTSG